MRAVWLTILTFLLFNSTFSFAQDDEKNPRILILMDGSSSMMKEWEGNQIRFEAAGKIVDKLMDSIYSVNKNVEFALRVYGHQSPTSRNNCYDSKLEVRFSKNNYTQMMLRMAALRPLGVSPIAYSLEQAATNDMPDLENNKYSLILITDGGESCDGDICSVVEQLLKKKIDFKPYILSLVDYAPLKSQYDCLGDYLLVTTPADIDPVVGKIVESYRTTFIQPVAPVKVIQAPTKKTEPRKIVKVEPPKIEVKTPEPEPEPEPVVKQEPPTPEVIVPKPEKKSGIVVTDVTKPRINEPALSNMRGITVVRIPVTISPLTIRALAIPLFKIPEMEMEPERPKEPTYKPMPVTPIKETVVDKLPPIPQIPDYTAKREETGETSLLIYLTDGKGKYYESAPEVELLDPRTGKVAHTFQRTVDAYGNPRPQKEIVPGNYDLRFSGKAGFMVPNIEVRENEKNEFEIIAPNGSLAFFYIGNRDRPVKEFNARVNMFLTRRNVTKQYCTEVLQYEPGNYHIDIGTNPIETRNVDLEPGAVIYIGIEEPGKVVINNPNGYKNIQFYYQRGDRYQDFKPMDVTGDLRRQEFLIQPGRYKILYKDAPNVPQVNAKEMPFIIKSNVITEVLLD